MTQLFQFTYLQILDLLTTLAFLTMGVHEANPIVRWAIGTSPSPAVGLSAVKCAAILLALLCWRTGRQRILVCANVFFAALILWNLTALVLRALGTN